MTEDTENLVRYKRAGEAWILMVNNFDLYRLHFQS